MVATLTYGVPLDVVESYVILCAAVRYERQGSGETAGPMYGGTRTCRIKSCRTDVKMGRRVGTGGRATATCSPAPLSKSEASEACAAAFRSRARGPHRATGIRTSLLRSRSRAPTSSPAPHESKRASKDRAATEREEGRGRGGGGGE